MAEKNLFTGKITINEQEDGNLKVKADLVITPEGQSKATEITGNVKAAIESAINSKK